MIPSRVVDTLAPWLAEPEADRPTAKLKAALAEARASGPHHWLAMTQALTLAWLLHANGRTAEARAVTASVEGARGVDPEGNSVDELGWSALGASWHFAVAAGDALAAEALAARVKATAPRRAARPAVDDLRASVLSANTEAAPRALNTLGRALADLAALAALDDTAARAGLDEGEAVLATRFAKKKSAAKTTPPAAPSTTTLVDWEAKKLPAALRSAASGSLGLLLERAAASYEQHKLTRRAALDAFVALAAGLLLSGHGEDALAACRRVRTPSTERVSGGGGTRRAAGALEVAALQAKGDAAAAKDVVAALGHVSFGFARGSKDEIRCWNDTAREFEREWAAATKPTPTDGDALAAACALYASCLASELDATKEARARMRTLLDDAVGPAITRALSGA